MRRWYTKPYLGVPINWEHELAQGLVACWLFNENGGGKVYDAVSYPHGNNGTLTNMDTNDWVQGKFGKALDFDGTNDYVDTSNLLNIGGGDFTLATWLNWDVFETSFIINDHSAVNGKWVMLYMSGTNLKFAIDDAILDKSNTYNAAANMSTGEWYYIVGVRDKANNRIKLYVDGVEVDNDAGTTADVTSDNTLRIGARRSAAGFYFDGFIDSVSIYNHALSPQEIQQLYLEPFCMFEYPSVARYFVSGGQSYFKTLTETVMFADSSQKGHSRAFTDNIGLADIVPKQVSVMKSEAVSFADVINKLSTITKQETLNLSDARLNSIGKNLIESLTLADVYSRQVVLQRTFQELINLNDAIAKHIGVIKTESLGFTDAIPKSPSKTLSDIVTVMDKITKSISILRQDNIKVSDTTTRNIQKSLIDYLLTTDEISKDTSKIFTENISLTDAIEVLLIIVRNFTETLKVSDTLVKDTSRTFIENLQLSDTFSRTSTLARVFLESTSLSDILKRDISKKFDEAIALSDSLGLSINKLLIESLTISDSKRVDIERTLQTSLSIVDSIAKNISIAKTETVDFADSLNKVIEIVKADTIAISDSFERQATFQRTFSELLSTLDSFKKAIAIIKQENIVVTDAVSLSYAVVVFLELAKLLAYLTIEDTILSKEIIEDSLVGSEVVTDTLEAKP